MELLSIPQSGGKISKRLGGIIGCNDKTSSSWHLNRFPDGGSNMPSDLKNLTSIQYLLFLALQGKETNFRGHKLTQNNVQKINLGIITKTTRRKSQHTRKNM